MSSESDEQKQNVTENVSEPAIAPVESDPLVEEEKEVELSNVVVDVVKDEVMEFVDKNFDLIKSEVLKELDDLATDFPLLDIVKIIIELVEKEGKVIKLNGEKKREAVVEICVRLGNELNKIDNDESKLIASILINKKSVEKQVDVIMKIHRGELQINLEDGLDDEIEIVAACCGGCLNPLLAYLSKKCACLKAQKKSKE